ncbi:hypothetical protein [Weissella sagaensis]|uniref:hypothetical protein n=1 Tax=Weissella sagaensis TaxID=2559928 RepID=UPI0013EA7938|nr:hypothetical protein [Weissella sagaensis]
MAAKATTAQSRQAEMAAKAASAQSRQAEGLAKVASAQSKAKEYAIRAASAQEKETAAIAKSVAQADKLASARQKDLALTQKYAAQTNQINKQAAMYGAGGSNGAMIAGRAGAKKPGRIREALGTGLSMFAPSMLLAGGIMSAAGGVKQLVTGSFDMLKERQNGQAMWATSIQDAHSSISGKRLTQQSVSANNAIMKTSLKAGNSFEEGNAIAKQIYSSDAGEYSGNTKKTNSMLRGMFNIQDANALTEGEMQRFRTAVGNIGDTGKMSGMQAKSLRLLDGKILRKIRKQYKKETGHELGKNRTGSDYDWGAVKAQTAFRGIDNYGNSGGVGKASERYNATLPGMLRSGKFAAQFAGSEIMDQFGKKVGKSGGFSNLIGNLSKEFTDFNKIKGFSDKASSVLSSAANELGTGISAITKVVQSAWKGSSSFRKGFGKGFTDEVGKIKDTLSSVGSFASDTISKIKGVLPKGSGTMMGEIGQVTGKVSALLLALKGASKLPVVGNLFKGVVGQAGKLLGKVPVIGGLLSKIFGNGTKSTAAGTMMTAADTMMAAANKMNGTGTGSGAGGDYVTRSAVSGKGKFTLGQKLANSKFGSIIDKTFLKGASLAGKGGFKGGLGKLLMGGASGLGKLSLGGAGLLSKFGKTGFGKFLGGSGKLLGAIGKRGAGGLNALFAGFDVFSALKNNKAGTTGRYKGVGSGIGGGVGGTLGAALGSFLGPVGTIAGGALGSWAGGKAGSWVGSKWTGIKEGTGRLWDKTKMGASDLFGKASIKFWDIKDQLSGALKGLKLSNPFKDFKMPDITKGLKLPNLSKMFKNFKLPNLAKGLKGLNIKNPFKGWKMPNISKSLKSLKLKIKNPFKNFKLPKFMKSNPFKKFKMPKIKFPKAPNWLKKITGWSKGANKAKKETDGANKSTKASSKHLKNAGKNGKNSGKSIGSSFKKAFDKAGKSTSKFSKSVGKAFKGVGKSGKSSMSKITSSIKSGMNKAKRAAKSGAKGITSALKFKNIGKSAKSAFNKLSSSVKSGMNKAKRAARSGSKGITRSIKSGLRGVSRAGKSSFNKLSSSVKSGMNKAKRAARSGSKGIARSVKSGLRSVGNAGKSSFNKLASSVRSGMNKAKRSARSGARGIANSVKSGLRGVGNAGRSSFNRLASSVRSGMNRAKRAARSGANGIVSSIRSGMNKASSAGRSSMSKFSSSITSGMSKAKSAARSGANQISSAIKSGLSKASTAGTSTMNKLTNTITSGMNKAASSAKSGANKISTALKSGFDRAVSAASQVRSLASAINSLHSKTVTITANVKGKGASKLAKGTTGAKSAFASLTPHYAKGTNKSGAHPGGLALVNDSKTSNWREAFMLPDGLVGIFPKKRNLTVPLPTGTQVLNGDDTKKMFPHYAKGTGGSKPFKQGGTINVTVNINGNASANDANMIANTIGEKLLTIMPAQTI